MRIYNPVGSKGRLLEIFQKVNNVKLNESMFESNGQDNGQNVLNNAFNQLKNNSLNVLKQDTQGGNDSFLQLNCKDNRGNNIVFRFETNSTEGDQEGVYNVSNTSLINFIFNSANGSENIELGKEELQDFNSEHGSEMFDVIDKYVDVESDDSENYDELAEAIKLIDAIKQDSYPFGGSPDDLQTGKGYADENPTNPALRVKSQQLDNFIQEGDDYPSEMPKGFSTGTERKKTKKAHKKTIKLSEDEETDMDMFKDNAPEETPELDIDQLSQDKEETGDMLQGGIGDDKSPKDFDYDQVLMGLEVEKEHSDNPIVALEIVLDHLTEDPQYYSTGENPEDSAQQNASLEASGEAEPDGDNDKEMTDLLLGYKPKNVGDNVNEINSIFDKLRGMENDPEYQEYLKYSKTPIYGLPREKRNRFFNLWKKFDGEDNSEEQMKIAETISGINEDFDYNDEKGYHANDRYKRYLQLKQMPWDNLSDDEKEELFQVWQEFRGAEPNELGEVYDHNDEKGYNTNDRYKKYLMYKQMDSNSIDNLSDDEFEEYSNLTNEFSGAELDEAYNPQELEIAINKEPFTTLKNELTKKYQGDERFGGVDIDNKIMNIFRNYYGTLKALLNRKYDINKLVERIYTNDLKSLGMESNPEIPANQSTNQTPEVKSTTQNMNRVNSTNQNPEQSSVQKYHDTRMDSREFKPFVDKLKEILSSKGLNANQIENKAAEIFTKNFTQITAKLARQVPVNMVVKMFTEV